MLYALLEAGELCVCDLSAATGISEATISQSLRLLRASRVVTGRREGRNVFYRLCDTHVRMLLDITREHVVHDADTSPAARSRALCERVHGHAGGRHRWRLGVAFVLIAGFFVVELVAGLLAQSLALLSDAGHMAADVVTLGAALFATRIATRTDRTGRRTFGSYRAEIFASGFAVLVMMGMSVYITIEAVRRLGQDTNPAAGTMLVVGGLGLLVNLIALFMLRGGAGESLNVKGAYLEVVADTLGSVGVIAAALLVQWTGDGWWDTLIALAIAVFVFVRAIFLAREVLTVLGQHAPQGHGA